MTIACLTVLGRIKQYWNKEIIILYDIKNSHFFITSCKLTLALLNNCII